MGGSGSAVVPEQTGALERLRRTGAADIAGERVAHPRPARPRRSAGPVGRTASPGRRARTCKPTSPYPRTIVRSSTVSTAAARLIPARRYPNSNSGKLLHSVHAGETWDWGGGRTDGCRRGDPTDVGAPLRLPGAGAPGERSPALQRARHRADSDGGGPAGGRLVATGGDRAAHGPRPRGRRCRCMRRSGTGDPTSSRGSWSSR